MPSPDELGVPRARAQADRGGDWGSLYRQLVDRGAICFQLERLPEGGFRCTCLLPSEQPDRTHRFEVSAGTEAEAVRLVLNNVEQRIGPKR
jgi:hypothetical protein